MGGCIVTDDDALAERMRFIGQSRGATMIPGFGRAHLECGYAYRMPLCTAAVCLAQLEVVEEHVAHRDRMIRALYGMLAEIPGIVTLSLPEYMEVFSVWMAGFRIDPQAFRCTPEEFAQQLAEAGIPGIGLGKYYLMPEAARFLARQAESETYPFSLPPASRRYRYGASQCPNAKGFLETFVRWATFNEKYQMSDCETVARLVGSVAERNRR
jgi:dTDP-4-amino-4,6-dideoxygalactose transaminase